MHAILRLCFKLVTIQGALCAISCAEGLHIGHVSNDGSTENGCKLQLPSDFARKAGLFVFTSDGGNQANINLGGVDKQLTLIKSKGEKHHSQLGATSSYWYSGPDDVQVQVDCRVTSSCPDNDRDCGLTYDDAILSVKQDRQRKTIAAKAVCSQTR